MEKAEEIYSFLRIVCSLNDNGPNNFATASLRLLPTSDGRFHMQGQIVLEVVSGINAWILIEHVRKSTSDYLSALGGEVGQALIYELTDKRMKDSLYKFTGALFLHSCLYDLENYYFDGQSCIVDFDFGITGKDDFQKLKNSLKQHIHRDFPRVKVAETPESFHLT